MKVAVEAKLVFTKDLLHVLTLTAHQIMPPNRQQRKKIAEETLKILESGFYLNLEGEKINFESELKQSLEESKCYDENQLGDLRSKLSGSSLQPRKEGDSSDVEVTNEFTIEACHRLYKELLGARIGCLNFASAKNVCGGMKGGSLAQEESIGLCSALHSVLSPFEKEYYNVNRRDPKEGLYHDNLIYSPRVPIFREDKNLILNPLPIFCDVITCPAPNNGRYKKCKYQTIPIEEVLQRRIANVLNVAIENEIEALILGAWGCGVFQNDAEKVASYFADLVGRTRGIKRHYFKKIVFAVGKEEAMLNIFQSQIL